ncbi:MAG: hypothetical protein RLP12_01210 [Ekhidna sp.]
MKKTILLTLLVILFHLPVFAQWSDNGTSLTTTDNVGIGISTLGTYSLSLKQSNTGTGYGMRIINGSSTQSMQFWAGGTGVVIDAEGDANLHLRTNNQDRIYIKNNGQIGVGTSAIGNYLFTLRQSETGAGNGMRITNGSGTQHMQLWSGGSGVVIDAEGNANLHLRTNNTDRLFIQNNGQVGIGTNSMGSHQLAVEGSIGAREIKVEASGWSDFVFEKDYELRTLEEVEQHINENGHLPEIPSEEEVTENGVNLGEMNAKLLQKIEELTLYMIDMNKRMNQLETENTQLKEKVQLIVNQ